jgi:hypothetical protein
MDYKQKDKFERKCAKFFGMLLISTFLSTPLSAENRICPENSKPYFFNLQNQDQKGCRGERKGNLCFECRTKDGTVLNLSFESQKKKIEGVKGNIANIGKSFTLKEIENIKNLIKEWDENELEKLIVLLNGNLNDEERSIFRGALEHWPVLKYHSIRLNIDPRITYLVALAENRFINKVGKSGELSPMQILPETAILMYNLYGKSDPYFIDLNKKEINWKEDVDALMILALYYLREGLKSVNAIGKSVEKMNAEDILLVYHFYNKGHNDYEPTGWWQGNNFATCATKYLKYYPRIDKFVEDFIKKQKYLKKKIGDQQSKQENRF